MTKKIRCYGIMIELALEETPTKRIPKYIRQKLIDNSFYIQRKRDGYYKFYYDAQPNDGVPMGYYTCEFSFREPPANVA